MRRVAILLLLLSAMVPAAWADQPPQKFVIYFQEWSAAIDGAAQDIITEVANMAKTQRGALHIVGFADPTGSKKANILLSELRAQRVVDLLTEGSVAPARLLLRGKGPVQFAVSSQEARRVEISFDKR